MDVTVVKPLPEREEFVPALYAAPPLPTVVV
jgi:hypothetical protein